jgi:hypothetical protein
MIDRIFFHGGGFYAICNYIGVVKRIHEEYKKPDSQISRNVKLYGNSAGASMAFMCLLVLYDIITIDYLESMATGNNNIFDIPKMISYSFTYLYTVMGDFSTPKWPNDLHERITDVLHVGVTTRNGHKFISKFKSNFDIYNRIICSGTLVGLSTYESKIDGELCLDGGYSFSYDCLPKDIMIIQGTHTMPVSLTIPPYFMRKCLIDAGYDVADKHITKFDSPNRELPMPYYTFDNSTIAVLFYIYERSYKNPLWTEHLMRKTRFIPESRLTLNLFDVFDYVYNTILNS